MTGPPRSDGPLPPVHPREAWESGDFSVLATGQVLVGELLCEAVDLRAGERVLDVATGSGNAALAAARRRARSVGVDYVPMLLERARERALAERVPLDLARGDLSRLPIRSGSVDCVLSTFGAIFAPIASEAAAELLRVCRPGGRLGLAVWKDEGFVLEHFALTDRYVPPPRGRSGPSDWSSLSRLERLFGPQGGTVQIRPRVLVLRAETPERMVAGWAQLLGPMVHALGLLPEERRGAMLEELTELVRRRNRSGDSTVLVPAEYLEVVVRGGESPPDA